MQGKKKDRRTYTLPLLADRECFIALKVAILTEEIVPKRISNAVVVYSAISTAFLSDRG
jgi:hypothetical protein